MKTYKFVGDVSILEQRNILVEAEDGDNQTILHNYKSYEIPPVKLEVLGEMKDYIRSLFLTDDEEKYLEKEFYYDENFRLLAVVIPGASGKPAKVIISGLADFAPKFECEVFKNRLAVNIYGPRNLINECKPESMPDDEYKRLRKDLDRLTVWNITEVSYPTDYYETIRHQERLIEQMEEEITKLRNQQEQIKELLGVR